MNKTVIVLLIIVLVLFVVSWWKWVVLGPLLVAIGYLIGRYRGAE